LPAPPPPATAVDQGPATGADRDGAFASYSGRF